MSSMAVDEPGMEAHHRLHRALPGSGTVEWGEKSFTGDTVPPGREAGWLSVPRFGTVPPVHLFGRLAILITTAVVASGCAQATPESTPAPVTDEAMVQLGPWTEKLTGKKPELEQFTGSVTTPCGAIATSKESYPFFCAESNRIYWPTNSKYIQGAVITHLMLSHENGHFIIAALGSDLKSPYLSERRSDCYAGAWLDKAQELGLVDADAEKVMAEVQQVFESTPSGGPYRKPEGRTSDVRTGMTLGPDACATINATAP